MTGKSSNAPGAEAEVLFSWLCVLESTAPVKLRWSFTLSASDGVEARCGVWVLESAASAMTSGSAVTIIVGITGEMLGCASVLGTSCPVVSASDGVEVRCGVWVLESAGSAMSSGASVTIIVGTTGEMLGCAFILGMSCLVVVTCPAAFVFSGSARGMLGEEGWFLSALRLNNSFSFSNTCLRPRVCRGLSSLGCFWILRGFLRSRSLNPLGGLLRV
ncbi:hypothetical protein IWZ00DRAFT_512064 [Phyllosticta capitalensis]